MEVLGTSGVQPATGDPGRRMRLDAGLLVEAAGEGGGAGEDGEAHRLGSYPLPRLADAAPGRRLAGRTGHR